MRVGLGLLNAGQSSSYSSLARVAQHAESLGYDSLWVTEREPFPLAAQPQRPDFTGEDTVVLSNSVALTSSLDALSAIAAGEGPQHSLFALGYAGWAPDQLEQELAAGAWVVVDPDEKLLFDQQIESKWQRALERQGVDL